MCTVPKMEKPEQLQAQKEPVFRDGNQTRQTRGRRGTILTGGSGIENQQYGAGKKTLLGS